MRSKQRNRLNGKPQASVFLQLAQADACGLPSNEEAHAVRQFSGAILIKWQTLLNDFDATENCASGLRVDNDSHFALAFNVCGADVSATACGRQLL